jgi:Methyltransferase domain
MNAVLREILATNSVSDGTSTLPLRHPDFPSLNVHMDEAEGALLAEIIRLVDPWTSAGLGHPARHIVMDPFQSTQWRGIGLKNLARAGFDRLIEFHEARSELLLPALLEKGTIIDFALIDGWHTFDQVMVEFYFIDRLLRVGGVVVFDDADRRSVNRVVRYALNYPGYEAFRTDRPAGRRTLKARIRRGLGRLPGAKRVLRQDFINRDWDLGIFGSCVALRKTADVSRSSGWYKDF